MKTQMMVSQGLIFLPILVSIFIFIINRKIFNYMVFPVQTLVTLLVIKAGMMLMETGIICFTLGGWDSSIGIELCIDQISWLFMLMACIIWWVVLIYAWYQRKTDFKFLFFLMFLEGCFFALLQVNDFFTFFVLIEIITILSAILIIYKKDAISVKAGLYYLLFNSMGMVIYLFGVMVLYFKTGTLNMTLVAEFLGAIDLSVVEFSFIHVSFAFIFVSMCVKAALFPVYEWLPRAHTAAPSYISALLSGLLVKTGLYGLIRVLAIFVDFDISNAIFYLGFFTAVSGILFAVSQKDIKAILAFHTISQIGLIIMSMAYGSDIGNMGAYLHLFNHFLFKSLLFLGAGIMINEYGVRRVTELRGIARSHPYLTLMMVISILSITGSPFFIGFISKNMMKLSSIHTVHEWLFRIISLGTIMSFIKFSKIFFGEPRPKRKVPNGPMIACSILSILIVVFYFIELEFINKFYFISNEALPKSLYNAIKYTKEALYDEINFLEYLTMVGIGYLLYKMFVKPESKFWHKIRHFRVKFQDAIIFLVLFLSLTLSLV